MKFRSAAVIVAVTLALSGCLPNGQTTQNQPKEVIKNTALPSATDFVDREFEAIDQELEELNINQDFDAPDQKNLGLTD